MNAHDSIVDAVLAALRAAPAVTAGVIEEEVDAATIAEGTQECISVALEASTPDRQKFIDNPTQWSSDLVLQCYARSDGRTAAGRASRALHARAYARLMADPSLGGLAMDLLEPELRGDVDQQDTRLGCLIATYRVLHRTQAGTLEITP